MRISSTFSKIAFISETATSLNEIPLNEKRKLTYTNKLALSTMSKVFTTQIEEIVTSSYLGEFERLKTIINQYKEFNEVSPMQFSASVHNYTAGFFARLKQISIPYYALSGGIATGITKAAISKHKNILYTLIGDKSISLVIKKNPCDGIKCKLINAQILHDKKEFEKFLQFLNGEISTFCNIERIQ